MLRENMTLQIQSLRTQMPFVFLLFFSFVRVSLCIVNYDFRETGCWSPNVDVGLWLLL